MVRGLSSSLKSGRQLTEREFDRWSRRRRLDTKDNVSRSQLNIIEREMEEYKQKGRADPHHDRTVQSLLRTPGHDVADHGPPDQTSKPDQQPPAGSSYEQGSAAWPPPREGQGEPKLDMYGGGVGGQGQPPGPEPDEPAPGEGEDADYRV